MEGGLTKRGTYCRVPTKRDMSITRHGVAAPTNHYALLVLLCCAGLVESYAALNKDSQCAAYRHRVSGLCNIAFVHFILQLARWWLWPNSAWGLPGTFVLRYFVSIPRLQFFFMDSEDVLYENASCLSFCRYWYDERRGMACKPSALPKSHEWLQLGSTSNAGHAKSKYAVYVWERGTGAERGNLICCI